MDCSLKNTCYSVLPSEDTCVYKPGVKIKGLFSLYLLKSSVLGSGFGELPQSNMVNISNSQFLDKLKPPGLSPFPAASSAQQNDTASPPATTAAWDLKPSAPQPSVLSRLGKWMFFELVYYIFFIGASVCEQYGGTCPESLRICAAWEN